MTIVLRGLQSLLHRLYDVEHDHDVYDFLITDRGALSRFEPDNDDRTLEEELLLAETLDGSGAGVALFLDAQLLQRLEKADPVGALTEENLADYCTALEGVSHFVYSTWRLSRGLPVSLLELETQAEVDKYAITVFLTALQQEGAPHHAFGAALRGRYPAHVHKRLFDRVTFDARLDAHQYERYRTAHRCAARFCRELERRFVKRGVARIEALVRELRKFYRLGSAQKLCYAPG
jgi:hypothetical protein